MRCDVSANGRPETMLPIVDAPQRRSPSLEIDCTLGAAWLVAFLREHDPGDAEDGP